MNYKIPMFRDNLAIGRFGMVKWVLGPLSIITDFLQSLVMKANPEDKILIIVICITVQCKKNFHCKIGHQKLDSFHRDNEIPIFIDL